MGRIYEALKRAENEKENNGSAKTTEIRRARVVESQPRRSMLAAVEGYGDLKTSFLARYPEGKVKTILFISTSNGNGSSTTAAAFAATMARSSRSRVLLADVNLRAPSIHKLFKIQQGPGVSDLLGNGKKTNLLIKGVGPDNLCVLPSGREPFIGGGGFEDDQFVKFVGKIQGMFDYVILDGPPFPQFPEAQMIGARVDGVVLVIEAGRTRRQVSLRAKKALEEAGCKLLGVVLNRRRYHIPTWVYERL